MSPIQPAAQAATSCSTSELIVDAVNRISEFLAHEEVRTASDLRRIVFESSTADSQVATSDWETRGVVVLCASAVLFTAESVLSKVTELAKETAIVLVLCGGIGHSTQLMHDAIARHPTFSQLGDRVRGQPEARILQAIGETFFDMRVHRSDRQLVDGGDEQNLTVLVEDRSTNCGLNAKMTRELLEYHGIKSPRWIVVAQDPTMCRRTVASFEKVYADQTGHPRLLTSWPTFLPKVTAKQAVPGEHDENPWSYLEFAIPRMKYLGSDNLWSMGRYLELVMGEIPRLRDDKNGYGPNGKGFIAHVDVPQRIEDSWEKLCELLGHTQRAGVNIRRT
ncbi:Fc.00g082640.m01.CDS01 [Cosmosporella sp. VM-42]